MSLAEALISHSGVHNRNDFQVLIIHGEGETNKNCFDKWYKKKTKPRTVNSFREDIILGVAFLDATV